MGIFNRNRHGDHGHGKGDPYFGSKAFTKEENDKRLKEWEAINEPPPLLVGTDVFDPSLPANKKVIEDVAMRISTGVGAALGRAGDKAKDVDAVELARLVTATSMVLTYAMAMGFGGRAMGLLRASLSLGLDGAEDVNQSRPNSKPNPNSQMVEEDEHQTEVDIEPFEGATAALRAGLIEAANEMAKMAHEQLGKKLQEAVDSGDPEGHDVTPIDAVIALRIGIPRNGMAKVSDDGERMKMASASRVSIAGLDVSMDGTAPLQVRMGAKAIREILAKHDDAFNDTLKPLDDAERAEMLSAVMPPEEIEAAKAAARDLLEKLRAANSGGQNGEKSNDD